MSNSAELHLLKQQIDVQEMGVAGLSQRESNGPAHDAPVFERLGYIVRSLHNTLHEIGADKVLSEAASEFPSARERLLHIASLTENAANIVLTKVEDTLPIQDNLVTSSEKLNLAWSKLPLDSTSSETLKPLAEETKAYIEETFAGAKTTRAALSDIMMAQDFQDLTGQLIKKVVTLLERTEKDLLKLLIDAAPAGTITEVKKEELMAGPGAPGSVALAQSSVDDLLADLGF
jgi:chemotaxis protein CheZ